MKILRQIGRSRWDHSPRDEVLGRTGRHLPGIRRGISVGIGDLMVAFVNDLVAVQIPPDLPGIDPARTGQLKGVVGVPRIGHGESVPYRVQRCSIVVR